MAEFEIRGADRMNRELGRLPGDLAKRALGNAVRAGMREIRNQARRNVPQRTGALRRSLVVRGKRKGNYGYQARLRIRTDRGGGWYAHMVEFGTDPHRIPKPRTGRWLRKALRIGGTTVAAVDHPGAEPQPFFSGAVESDYRDAFDVFAEKLNLEIGRAWVKAGER